MRIFWDCRSIAPHMGGIGQATANWFRGFMRHRPQHWRVAALFSRINSEEFIQKTIPEIDLGVEIHLADAGMVAPYYEQLQLPILLRNLQIDLYFNPSFTVPAIRTTQFQIAVVHDLVFLEHPNWVEPDLARYLLHGTDLALRTAQHIFTVSEFSQARLRHHAAERRWSQIERTSVLYPTLDKVMPAQAPAGQTRQPFVLYVGSMEEKKGTIILLDAYRLLKIRLGVDCPPLILAGGVGGQQFDVETAIRHREIEQQVRYLGRISEAQKWELLRTARSFVFPSLYEGFGIPPLEALSVGTPVIATNATSLPEVLGDAAYYVPANDAPALCEAIDRLRMDQSLCADFAARCLAQVKKFQPANEVRKIIEVMSRLERAG